jgi:hypothetical protein
MRFSLFAVLSGLAALAVVDALPDENARLFAACCEVASDVSLTFHANK